MAFQALMVMLAHDWNQYHECELGECRACQGQEQNQSLEGGTQTDLLGAHLLLTLAHAADNPLIERVRGLVLLVTGPFALRYDLFHVQG